MTDLDDKIARLKALVEEAAEDAEERDWRSNALQKFHVGYHAGLERALNIIIGEEEECSKKK